MLNVQTEHLENHTARITVDVDAEQINQAMRQAARQIAKKARIPGFRPGKAPFNVVVTMFGYEYVLGEALEKIGNDIYRQALDASGVKPYAPGNLENMDEGGQKLTFIVPKQPEVELGDYRDVRVEHEPIEVTDDMLNRTIEKMRQDEALVEEVDRAAKLGDQVRFSHVAVTLLPTDNEDTEEADEDEDAEAAGEDADDVEDSKDDIDIEDEIEAAQRDDNDALGDDLEDEDDDDLDDDDSEVILHEHNYEYRLYEDPEQEELFPGFADEVVDSVADDELVFQLEIPEDYDDENLAGRTLECEAHVEQVYSRIVPEWTDGLANRVSDGKSETMLELRINTRKDLEESAENLANRDVAMKALDKIIEGATVKYPEELVQDYITDLVETLEQNIKQQGLTLKDWYRITGQTENDLREQYRQAAVARAERALVMSEIVRQEKLTVSADDIDAEIDLMVTMFGSDEQAAQFRQFFSSPQSRLNIQTDLLSNRAMDRLAAIAKGENPPIVDPDAAAETADEDQLADVANDAGEAIPETMEEEETVSEPEITSGETTETE
jgi:trigger factor